MKRISRRLKSHVGIVLKYMHPRGRVLKHTVRRKKKKSREKGSDASRAKGFKHIEQFQRALSRFHPLTGAGERVEFGQGHDRICTRIRNGGRIKKREE